MKPLESKICSVCKESKAVSLFTKGKGGVNYRSECRKCNAKRVQEFVNKKTPEEQRLRRVQMKYKITPSEYQQMLEVQDNKCVICRRSFTEVKPLVDHDHSCCATKYTCGWCVRGLLCDACNRTLGYALDSPKILRAAADYVEFYRIGKEIQEAT